MATKKKRELFNSREKQLLAHELALTLGEQRAERWLANTKAAILTPDERRLTDSRARVAAWPLDDEPIFLAWPRLTPHRYWRHTLEFTSRLPQPLTENALRAAAAAYREAQIHAGTSPHQFDLPATNWRRATLGERIENVLLAYQCANREWQAAHRFILPPITQDAARIERKRRERERIAAAVRGELPIPEGSRLERIVAAHRLYESTRGKVDIRAAVTQREMPDQDDQPNDDAA